MEKVLGGAEGKLDRPLKTKRISGSDVTVDTAVCNSSRGRAKGSLDDPEGA
jgi:hypothetical protein